ncbi:CIC11C00000002849 [Sungouiella intermedia]|uniref:Histone acetyltransferase type B catalytic subunit n=1 Tax=Sungouiella intermedia TaxID=45354 RepID=A0A1L0BBQ0_9ASCO|nr:CIC11C00000002849 [[Candida] intermedia]
MSQPVNLAVASLQPEQWTASSNEAMSIYITDTKGSAQTFKPVFTYPIFGDAESIFGYKDLVIFLCFDSVTFLPFLNVKWSAKLDDVEIDPKEKMLEFLPESTVFKDELKWREAIEEEQKDYEVPGTHFGEEFTKDGEKYAIYRLDLSSSSGAELHKRLQILVLLFIEAGSYIDFKDPLWDIYVLYKTTDPKLPEVVGFATAYNYWKYPGLEKFDTGVVETRQKISQFIILPIFQGKSLGGEFYSRLVDEWLQDDKIVEIVVEEPNESFDDLRDRADLTRLNRKSNLGNLDIATVTSDKWFENFKKTEKLEKRQLQRLLEMIFFKQLKDGSSVDSKKSIRLFVKRRLYEKNKEALSGLDAPTRLDKLQTAYEALESDYYRILEPTNFKFKRAAESKTNGKAKKAKIN